MIPYVHHALSGLGSSFNQSGQGQKKAKGTKVFLSVLSALWLALGSSAHAQVEALPPDTIRWETVPAAIRADGMDTFTIQVHVPQPARSVTVKPLSGYANYITPAPGLIGYTLKDDGLGADKVAGDKIYTAGPFKYDTNKAFPANYGDDAKSPAGIYLNFLGQLSISFQDGTSYPSFMTSGRDPMVGLVRKDLPAPSVTQLNATTTSASHVVVKRYDRYGSEGYMRSLTIEESFNDFVRGLYSVLPDNYDQIAIYPTFNLQGVGASNRHGNGISGIHFGVKNDIKGIGLRPFDYTATYGSAGRLKGINSLWLYGMQSWLLFHEIGHTWISFLTHPTYRIAESGHWLSNNSLGSTWKDNGNGTFTLDCNATANQAGPMMQYLMGVAPSTKVPHVRALENNEQFGPGYECGKLITKPYGTISINDLIAANGPREPAYGQAQTQFNLLFVIHALGRNLNATEITFYNTLAKHLAVTDTTPASLTDKAWRPLSSYYPGTTWQTAVNVAGGADTVAPVITLNGAATMELAQNSTFTDPGATAQDNVDGNISSSIVRTGSVNTATVGTYVLRYNVKDRAGNAAAELTRTVKVVSQTQSCVKATNYQHVAAGRAYQKTVSYSVYAYAQGSNNSLGSYGSAWYSPTTYLKETSPGYWIKVTACP